MRTAEIWIIDMKEDAKENRVVRPDIQLEDRGPGFGSKTKGGLALYWWWLSRYEVYMSHIHSWPLAIPF
jgi:hypothetical protein